MDEPGGKKEEIFRSRDLGMATIAKLPPRPKKTVRYRVRFSHIFSAESIVEKRYRKYALACLKVNMCSALLVRINGTSEITR